MEARIKDPAALRSETHESFLPPIERPKGIVMKLVYAMTRRQFGRVLTPIRVFAARLPPAFGRFYGKINALDKKLLLPADIRMLIRQQVAQINVCLFCIDIGRYYAIRQSHNQEKLDALGEYQSSSQFNDAERAALDYVTELTRSRQVAPETFARLARHYSEREICEIAWLVASEHLYNMTNLALNIHADLVCDIAKKTSRIK